MSPQINKIYLPKSYICRILKLISSEIIQKSLYSRSFMGFWKWLQMVTEEWRQVVTLPLKKAVWLEFVCKIIVFFFISTYYIISYLFSVVNPFVKQSESLFQECNIIALNTPFFRLYMPLQSFWISDRHWGGSLLKEQSQHVFALFFYPYIE